MTPTLLAPPLLPDADPATFCRYAYQRGGCEWFAEDGLGNRRQSESLTAGEQAEVQRVFAEVDRIRVQFPGWSWGQTAWLALKRVGLEVLGSVTVRGE